MNFGATKRIGSKKNNIKIDLGAFTKGYITELVGNYLEDIGIDKYLIDAGGNIKVGNNYKKENILEAYFISA